MTKEKFYQLTPEDQRVAVAKDVIEQLIMGRIIASEGIYTDPIKVTLPDELGNIITDDMDAQQFIGKLQGCEACAMGACLLSLTHLGNKLTVYQVDKFGQYPDKLPHEAEQFLSSVFPPHQMMLMEYAFEGWGPSTTGNDKGIALVFNEALTDEEVAYTESFYLEFTDEANDDDDYWLDSPETNDDELMKAIMVNIIKNNGTFKPEQYATAKQDLDEYINKFHVAPLIDAGKGTGV